MTTTRETTIWCDGVDGVAFSCGEWSNDAIATLLARGWRRSARGVHRCPSCARELAAKP